MKTTLIQVQATHIKSLIPKFLNIEAKQHCSGQYSNRIARKIFPSKRYITSLIAASLQRTLHWAVFSVLQYGTWEEAPTETRYALKCRHEPFCWETTSSIEYAQAILITLLGMTCVREVRAMAAHSRAEGTLLLCSLSPQICCNVQKQIKIK